MQYTTYTLAFLYCLLSMQVVAQRSHLDTVAIAGVHVELEHLINTPNAEFSPTFFDDKVGYVYSSSRGRQLDRVIGEPFYDLGYAAQDTSGMLALSASFAKEINSLGHEGPFALAGDLIYFTRVDGVRIDGKNRYVRRLYQADVLGAEVAPLSFSTEEVTACHPTLTSDGLTMIFSGDLDQTGIMSLYQSSYIGDQWSTPERLPLTVNDVEYHDFFPFLYQDSMLVFASDRPGGYGGYDMYTSTKRGSQWTDAQLVPAPFNSRWDDLGLIIRADGKKGYFSSNRPGGKGKDDIYNFSSVLPIINSAQVKKQMVSYTIVDKLTFAPVTNATVKVTRLELTQAKLNVDDYNIDLLPGAGEGELLLKLKPKNGQEVASEATDANGKVQVELLANDNYIVTVIAPEYESSTFVYAHSAYGETMDIVLEPKAVPPPPTQVLRKTPTPQAPPQAAPKVPPPPAPTVTKTEEAAVVIPQEAGAVVVFDNVYYDSNRATLRAGAIKELDALVDAMLLNPNMRVELSSHTDSRGEANYNLLLSEERALSAKRYLTDRGINPRRIATVGHGERHIRNKCVNGVPCTKEEHRYNRRTEVTITRI